MGEPRLPPQPLLPRPQHLRVEHDHLPVLHGQPPGHGAWSHRPLDGFVEFITSLRLEAGFSLSKVQEAFDLFRVTLVPRIIASNHLFVPCRPWNPATPWSLIQATVSPTSSSLATRRPSAATPSTSKRKVLRSRKLAASERQQKTLVEEINDSYGPCRTYAWPWLTALFARCTMPPGARQLQDWLKANP